MDLSFWQSSLANHKKKWQKGSHIEFTIKVRWNLRENGENKIPTKCNANVLFYAYYMKVSTRKKGPSHAVNETEKILLSKL